MLCKVCGTVLRKGSKYCHQCGNARYNEAEAERQGYEKETPLAHPEVEALRREILSFNPDSLSECERIQYLLEIKEAERQVEHLKTASVEELLFEENGYEAPKKEDLYSEDVKGYALFPFIPDKYKRTLHLQKDGEKFDYVCLKPSAVSCVFLSFFVMPSLQVFSSLIKGDWRTGLMGLLISAPFIALFVFCILKRCEARKAGKEKIRQLNKEIEAYNNETYPQLLSKYNDLVAARTELQESQLESTEMILDLKKKSFGQLADTFPNKYNNYDDLRRLKDIFEDFRADNLPEAINLLIQDKREEESLAVQREKAAAEIEAQERMAMAAEVQAAAARAQAKTMAEQARNQEKMQREAQYEAKRQSKNVADAKRRYDAAVTRHDIALRAGRKDEAARAQADMDRAMAEMISNK